MSPRDLVFRVLLITIVRFSTASIIRPQRLLIVRLSPKSARSLEDVPDGWKTMEFKAPQIEIELLKSHVSPDENWKFTNEYKYSGKNYHVAAKVTSTKDEKKLPRIESGEVDAREKEKRNAQDNVMTPDHESAPPQFLFRDIITLPKCFYQKGQRIDKAESCRLVISDLPQIESDDVNARERAKRNILEYFTTPGYESVPPHSRSGDIVVPEIPCPKWHRKDKTGYCRFAPWQI